MGKMNFALVGCGNIAKKYVHVFQNHLDNARLVGFCDPWLERAKKFADEVGAPAFLEAGQMMDKIGDTVDALCILTPSGVHVNNVDELVQYGKPLIIEKPMALRLDEADEIIWKCDAHKVKIFVVHQNRYNLPIIKAREAFDQGRFGKLVMGTVRLRWKRDQAYYDSADWRGTWAYDGGVFTNQASHHIDMLTWFMGEVESVKAVGMTRLVNIECEDTGAAIFKFSNGSLGIVEATTATRPRDLEGSISILGEKGTVVIGGFFMNELTTWEFEDRTPEDDEILEKFGKNPDGWGYNVAEYLKDVIRAISENRRGLVDGLEGRKSLELISAIYESIETGNDIDLRFRPKRCKLGVL
ncbi:MAG: Gfo/Idh/MocA family oxidoreductase [bacterium]|nr:MAG: Gfo/Idh/MocA family oxidoreductase [bacterium]